MFGSTNLRKYSISFVVYVVLFLFVLLFIWWQIKIEKMKNSLKYAKMDEMKNIIKIDEKL